MSRALRTPGLPPTHGPVGYRWQNTGSMLSLINTRATSCRTSPVGVGAGVLPEWRRGERPEASGGNMQSASDTPSSHSRREWRSPSSCLAASSWRSRYRSGAYRGDEGCRQGASPSGGRSPRTDSRATRDTPGRGRGRSARPRPRSRRMSACASSSLLLPGAHHDWSIGLPCSSVPSPALVFWLTVADPVVERVSRNRRCRRPVPNRRPTGPETAPGSAARATSPRWRRRPR